jgi:hypothetical protein
MHTSTGEEALSRSSTLRVESRCASRSLRSGAVRRNQAHSDPVHATSRQGDATTGQNLLASSRVLVACGCRELRCSAAAQAQTASACSSAHHDYRPGSASRAHGVTSVGTTRFTTDVPRSRSHSGQQTMEPYLWCDGSSIGRSGSWVCRVTSLLVMLERSGSVRAGAQPYLGARTRSPATR